MQHHWASCPKCQGLHYAGHPTTGVCPAGGQHEQTGSFAYEMEYDAADSGGLQAGWASCPKCQGLHFAGHQGFKGACPAGGQHEQTGSFAYAVPHGQTDPGGQADWRACPKCQGLFFGPFGGRCAAGGAHSADGSWNYWARCAALHRFTFDAGISQADRVMLTDRHRAAFLSINDCNQLDADAKGKLFTQYRSAVKHGFNTDPKANASARVGGDTILVNFSNFANLPDDERSQTLIHEMAHLAGYNHPDKQATDVPGDGRDYYGSVPLQAEMCVAGVQSDTTCGVGEDLMARVTRRISPDLVTRRSGRVTPDN